MPRLPESELLLSFNQLVKTAEENAETKKYKDETHARVGSDNLEDIASLYNLKPDGQFKDKSVVEVAHPDTLVIAPAYDKLNALVENEEERADIIRNIVTKPTDGLLTNYRYAQQNLSLSLIRLANYLDSTNQEELRILADQCLENLHSGKKKLFKTAFAQALPIVLNLLFTILPIALSMRSGKPGAAPTSTAKQVLGFGAVLAGAAGLANHINEYSTQGLAADLPRAITATSKILTKPEIQSNPALSKSFNGLLETLQHLQEEMSKFSQLELIHLNFKDLEIQKQMNESAELKNILAQELIFIKQFGQDLQKLDSKLDFYKLQINQAATIHPPSGTLDQLWKLTKEFFSSDDFEQLTIYLNNVHTSMQPILNMITDLTTAINQLAQAKPQLEQAHQELTVSSPIESTPELIEGSDDWIFE